MIIIERFIKNEKAQLRNLRIILIAIFLLGIFINSNDTFSITCANLTNNSRMGFSENLSITNHCRINNLTLYMLGNITITSGGIFNLTNVSILFNTSDSVGDDDEDNDKLNLIVEDGGIFYMNSSKITNNETDSSCLGTAAPCSVLGKGTGEPCIAQAGCVSGGQDCTGTVQACGKGVSQYSEECDRQIGCGWEGFNYMIKVKKQGKFEAHGSEIRNTGDSIALGAGGSNFSGNITIKNSNITHSPFIRFEGDYAVFDKVNFSKNGRGFFVYGKYTNITNSSCYSEGLFGCLSLAGNNSIITESTFINGSDGEEYGVINWDASNVYFNNNTVRESAAGLILGKDADVFHNVISNNTFENLIGAASSYPGGIIAGYFWAANYINITKNLFRNIDTAGINTISASYNASITYNTFINSSNNSNFGVILLSTLDDDWEIKHNTFNTSREGILITNTLSNITIINNTFYNLSSNGIRITAAASNITLINNTFMNNTGAGFSLSSATAKDVFIYDNLFCFNKNGSVNNLTYMAVENNTFCVNLMAPANNYQSQNPNFTFSFNVSNVFFNTTCDLIVNDTVRNTNISVSDFTNTSFNFLNASKGKRNWTVRCNDSSNNTGIAPAIIFNRPNIGPVIDDFDNQSVIEDLAFKLQITSFDYDGDAVTYSQLSGTLFTITSNGTISFTPNHDNVEVSSTNDTEINTTYTNIRILASDADGTTHNKYINFSVTPVNDPPVLIFTGNLSVKVNKTIKILINATDEENDIITFDENSSIFNFEWSNNTGAFVNFTPNDSQIANYSINFSATDGLVSTPYTNISYDYEIIILSVLETNRAPNITSFSPNSSGGTSFENITSPVSFSMNVGNTQQFNITSEDPDNDPTSNEWFVDNVNILNNSINYSYTPGAARTTNISVRVNDTDVVNDTHEWRVTVNAASGGSTGGESGTGGGGGGGCVEVWECEEWGPCLFHGKNTRRCTDKNNCRTEFSKPGLEQDCKYETKPGCSDGILNQDEILVDCGGICKPCPTCTDGIQNQKEESVDCGGPCDPCIAALYGEELKEICGDKKCGINEVFTCFTDCAKYSVSIPITAIAAMSVLSYFFFARNISLLAVFLRKKYLKIPSKMQLLLETSKRTMQMLKTKEETVKDKQKELAITIKEYIAKTFEMKESFTAKEIKEKLEGSGVKGRKLKEISFLLNTAVNLEYSEKRLSKKELEALLKKVEGSMKRLGSHKE